MADLISSTSVDANDPFSDAEQLGERHDLSPSDQLADILMWTDRENYGEDSPWTGDAGLRRPHGPEMQLHLQSIVEHAKALLDYDLALFPGVLGLACADMFGARRATEIAGAIRVLLFAEERAEPLETAADMAELIAVPLAHEWATRKDDRHGSELLSFAGDALRDRWDMPDQMLCEALGKALRSIGYPSAYQPDWEGAQVPSRQRSENSHDRHKRAHNSST